MIKNKKKRLIIIDANSIIHRAFHALPPLTNKKGEQIGAVYGFLLAFFKSMKDFEPDFVAACFDVHAPTFRHKKFKQYKAKRPLAPKELYNQIPKVKKALKVLNVPIFEKQGFEADDIIGTIAKLAPRKQVIPELETIILTGDRDALQLVNAKIRVFALNRGIKNAILYDQSQVQEKYGISSQQIIDYKALRGDASDNIPGVTGVGDKTAVKLLQQFESLENLYQELETGSEKAKEIKPKLRELLLQYKEQAFLSKFLATIKKDVLIDFNLKNCQWRKYNEEQVLKAFKRWGFNSLIKRLSALSEQKTIQKKKKKVIQNNLKLW